MPEAVRVVAAILLLDYTLWWWHWLSHRVPFLWRFHLVHHVDRDLDASTAFRFHFGEHALSVFYRMAQVVIIGASPAAPSDLAGAIDRLASRRAWRGRAGRALGLKPLQIFRLVVLKPAIQAIYPSLTSQFILLLLNSSVCSAIAATELTAAAGDIQSRTFRSFEVYFVITCIYFVLSLFFWGVFGMIEKTWLRTPARR